MTDPISQFVDPMRRRFAPPKGIDEAAFLSGVAEAVSSASAHQLAMALDHFRNTRESFTFPSAAECRRVCMGYEQTPSAAIYRDGRKWQTAEEERSQETFRRQARIDAFKACRCGMGTQADREGWLNALIDFVEDHRRLPDGREIDRVKALAQRNEDALAQARGTAFYSLLAGLRKAMHERARADVFGYVERKERAA